MGCPALNMGAADKSRPSRTAEGVGMSSKPRVRRPLSDEMLEARRAASEVRGAEARAEKERKRLAAKSRQHKKEVNKDWVHVWQGGAPQ